MAMAMVQKARPLVPMNEKPTTATPDYDTFQLFFRKAEEILSSSSNNSKNKIGIPLCEKLNSTEEFIEG